MTPHLRTHGDPDDPLLLCLHGIGSCADAFVGQFPLAERCGRFIVSWDAPGYRHSADVAAPFGLDDWADAAAEVIVEHGGGGPADVLGVSWGGVSATRLALRHPALVRSLILADSSVGSGIDPEVADAMRGRATDLAALGHEEFCRSRAPRLVRPDASAEFIEQVAQMMIESVRLETYDLACRSMADTDHTPRLGEILVPTLVLIGEHDIVTPMERATALVAGIDGADLIVIDDAGHLANQEQPEAVNTVVGDFLARVNMG
ncbi:MAG: alpha/beta fold hydrolase [Actinomycetota bacterium]